MRAVVLVVLALWSAGCTVVSVSDGNETHVAIVREGEPTKVGNTTVGFRTNADEWDPHSPPERPRRGAQTTVDLVSTTVQADGVYPKTMLLELRNTGDRPAVMHHTDVVQGTSSDWSFSVFEEEIAAGTTMVLEVRTPGYYKDVGSTIYTRVVFENAAEVRSTFVPRGSWALEVLPNVTWDATSITHVPIIIRNQANYPISTFDFELRFSDETQYSRATVVIPQGGSAVALLPVDLPFARTPTPSLVVDLQDYNGKRLAGGSQTFSTPRVTLHDVTARVGWCAWACQLQSVNVTAFLDGEIPLYAHISEVIVNGARHEPWESYGSVQPGNLTTLYAKFGFADVPEGSATMIVKVASGDGRPIADITRELVFADAR